MSNFTSENEPNHEKKPWTTPTLVVHGDIDKLTHDSKSQGRGDGLKTMYNPFSG